MRIKVAGKKSTLFYWTGLSKNNQMFFPVSNYQKLIIKKALNNFEELQQIIPTRKRYADFYKIKKSILVNDSSKLPINYIKKANKLKSILTKKIKKANRFLKIKFNKFGLKYSDAKFIIFIIPYVGENAETLDNVLVLGDEFNPFVAIGVVIEELLHALIKENKMSFKKLKNNISKELNEEAHVGYLLYELLQESKLVNKNIRESLVFGWQGGKRKELVNKILQAPPYFR